MPRAGIATGDLLAGRYRVRERLGTGGMSAVFRATDETLGRDVAVKVFPPALAHDGDEERRRDEVRVLASLAHPALVVLFDAALASDPPFLTMEWVEGETLAARLRRGPLDAAEFETLGAAIAGALAYVHDNGVIHRDVKPANVLLPATPTSTSAPAKLADFGIARVIDGGKLTDTGTVVGTAAYLSPEQATGSPATPASDVYALGLVFIECLTGVHPFPGTALESASARLARSPDLEAAALLPFRSLIARMTAHDPDDRPSAAEVVENLAGAAPTRRFAAFEETGPLPPVDASPTAVGSGSTTERLPIDVPTAAAPPATSTMAPASASARGRRRVSTRALAVACAIVGVLAIGAVATAAAVAGSTPAVSAPTTPEAPTYPAVDGALGEHLALLQDAVEPVAELHEPVAALTDTAPVDPATATAQVDTLRTSVDEGVAAGTIDEERAGRIRASLDLIAADLAAAIAAATPTEEPAGVIDDPADVSGPGNGNGNGNGNGKPEKPEKPGKKD